MGLLQSQPKATSHDKAVFELKRQRDRLKKYQVQLEQISNRETELAKHALQQGDRTKAALALKRKRLRVQMLDKSEKTLMQLEEMTTSLEYAMLEKQVVEGLAKGNEALAALHQIMSVEKVEAIMQETADAIAYQQEIETAMGTALTAEDEEAVLAELDQITQLQVKEDIEAKLPSVPVRPVEVPKTEGPSVEEAKSKQKIALPAS